MLSNKKSKYLQTKYWINYTEFHASRGRKWQCGQKANLILNGTIKYPKRFIEADPSLQQTPRINFSTFSFSMKRCVDLKKYPNSILQQEERSVFPPFVDCWSVTGQNVSLFQITRKPMSRCHAMTVIKFRHICNSEIIIWTIKAKYLADIICNTYSALA